MDEEEDPREHQPFDDVFGRLFEDLRKSASIKAGAVMFGQAQLAYYEVLKSGMTEVDAYNMLAHTTDKLLGAMAHAAGPIAEAMLTAAAAQEEKRNSQHE